MDTAIDKALVILESLETGRGNRSLASIAAATGLPKSTVHRILAILERRAYVQQDAFKDYSLGPKIIALGAFAGERSPLVSAAGPLLDRLVRDWGETVHLGILVEDSLLYVDRREPQDIAVRLVAAPSPLSQPHASAGGKVLLAFGDERLLDTVIAGGLTRYTAATIVDPDRLKAELARVRESGYATSEQERNEGVRAVAVPVRNRSGAVVATISAAGPTQRMTDEKLHSLRVALAQAAATLSPALR
ncbi:IclR family transcriptional regulator [Nonomuraea glycinis]|uniref:IclR family transcriptional regulator n=1 Tax=Nonomuraea glycinis TaxID=2047744 RepID=A0A918ADX3_9ACTN|nr:IclR family transcriptional regulator [Nonomuraea glycinis]MCA2181260.1 IclR family transcriptional regulator [Nonomuraea glycinis]GGP13337.1 IclR family transcriptional regulator [Nonomuraea glycinis]